MSKCAAVSLVAFVAIVGACVVSATPAYPRVKFHRGDALWRVGIYTTSAFVEKRANRRQHQPDVVSWYPLWPAAVVTGALPAWWYIVRGERRRTSSPSPS